jgi:hypothetical protein
MSREARIQDEFFGRIISMIPVDLYRPKESGDDDEVDLVTAIQESKYYKVSY